MNNLEFMAASQSFSAIRWAYIITAIEVFLFALLAFAAFMTLRSLTQWLNAKTRTEEMKQQQIQLDIDGRSRR